MTTRQLDRVQLRRLDAYATGTLGVIADGTRADHGGDYSVFPLDSQTAPDPVLIGLGGSINNPGVSRPASGMMFSIAALAAGAGSIGDNGTATIRVYGAEPVPGAAVNKGGSQAQTDTRARLLFTLTVTFGGKLETVWVGGRSDDGGQSGGRAVQVRHADTIAMTLSPYGTLLLETAYGAAPQVFSPGDNTVAQLIAPQLPGLSGLIFDAEASADAELYLDAKLVA